MAKSDKKKSKNSNNGTATAIGLLAAGVVAAGAAFMASRRQADAGDELVDTFDADDDIDLADASVAAVQTIPVGEPMRYTGSGTPDMAVSYTPGLDELDRDDDTAIGDAEQRNTMSGVNA